VRPLFGIDRGTIFCLPEEMKMSPALLGLDAMVVNIELTLSSIVQAVALTFLIENARTVLAVRDAATWLYVFSGLCSILIFWSRSILHTLTLIRWPLEFGHNFLYIACTFAECLLFTCLANPTAWFELSTLYAIAVLVLFAYDMRMTNVREADRPSEASRRLCEMIARDQRLNIFLLMPLLLIFNLGCAGAIYRWPDFFLARHGHVYLIAGQFLGLAIYLYYVVRFFARLAPLILLRQEERRALASGDR
jgi:hypothetical protein